MRVSSTLPGINMVLRRRPATSFSLTRYCGEADQTHAKQRQSPSTIRNAPRKTGDRVVAFDTKEVRSFDVQSTTEVNENISKRIFMGALKSLERNVFKTL